MIGLILVVWGHIFVPNVYVGAWAIMKHKRYRSKQILFDSLSIDANKQIKACIIVSLDGSNFLRKLEHFYSSVQMKLSLSLSVKDSLTMLRKSHMHHSSFFLNSCNSSSTFISQSPPNVFLWLFLIIFEHLKQKYQLYRLEKVAFSLSDFHQTYKRT